MAGSIFVGRIWEDGNHPGGRIGCAWETRTRRCLTLLAKLTKTFFKKKNNQGRYGISNYCFMACLCHKTYITERCQRKKTVLVGSPVRPMVRIDLPNVLGPGILIQGP